MEVKVLKSRGWVFYTVPNIPPHDPDKSGKWMYFWTDRAFVEEVCKEAISTGVVSIAKHSDASDGVACFYLQIDDFGGHKKVIRFFLDKGLVKKTKAGRFYDISFKLDNQTRAGEYGDNFKGRLRLSNFIDLGNGAFK
ncbi:hypothetical protein GMRT_13515 [Giardia muris]|uniref:Uncharacterized protein n=1 Tax=Giardia muris TaxID=5742 RepID=A0A4Z1SQ54_GIAMU|nr:hypothetical protein GMRT_13515 [Giardia muris]|eukprot:TNJ27972.1 hypothetical protein GMRT_13515 [Giardia muris]